MSDNKQSFKEMVRTCLKEVKEERTKKEQLREALKKYVRQTLNEIISAPDAPEQDEKETEKINKGYDKEGNVPSEETQDQQVQELTKIVHGINADFNVYRDTNYGGPNGYTSGKRNFIVIDAGDFFSVRIKERWENNFDIEAFVKESDRVFALGLNWAQVKAFVKANFGEINKTKVQTAKGKVDKNREDQTDKADKDLPQTDLVKNRLPDPEHSKLKTTKKDDMDYKKDDVEKDEDQPSAPMKPVSKAGKDPETKNKAKDNKETPQVKPPKHKNDDELVKRMPGKKK